MALNLPIDLGLTLHHIGQSVEDFVQRARCAIPHAQGQPAPREQEENKHGEGVEIDRRSPPSTGLKGGQSADAKGDGHAQCHGQVHANAPRFEVLPSALPIGRARKHQNGQAQHPTGPMQELQTVPRDVGTAIHILGSGVHHHLHHAKACHGPLPNHQARFNLSLDARQRIVGGYGLVARLLDRFKPA